MTNEQKVIVWMAAEIERLKVSQSTREERANALLTRLAQLLDTPASAELARLLAQPDSGLAQLENMVEEAARTL